MFSTSWSVSVTRSTAIGHTQLSFSFCSLYSLAFLLQTLLPWIVSEPSSTGTSIDARNTSRLFYLLFFLQPEVSVDGLAARIIPPAS